MKNIQFTVNGIRNSPDLPYKEMKSRLGRWPSAKTCNVMTLDGILKSHFNCVAACRFTCGHRPRIGTADYNNTFNKTVLIDFDYKNVTDRPGASDPNIVFFNLQNYLCSHCDAFYYFENSLHTNKNGQHDSAHLLFYYNDITVDNYSQYYKHAVNQVVNALINMYGAKPSWVFDVIDKQCANPSHIIFITGINAFFNPGCTGDIRGDELPPEMEHSTAKPVFAMSSNYTIVDTQAVISGHLDRGARWKLYANLYTVYNGDMKQISAKWEQIMKQMAPRKHDTLFYINEPVMCRWNESANRLTSLDKYLLLKYGVVVM